MNELNDTMLKIDQLERKIVSRCKEIEKRYKQITCGFSTFCKSPSTHLLVTGLGEYPNYVETNICTKCSAYVCKLNCYQKDILGLICLHKL